MKAIRLFDWSDRERMHCVREVPVQSVQEMTRNGKDRVYVWTGKGEEFNLTLYPEFQTAYPEYEGRVQKQRVAERFYYEAVD